MPFLMNRYRYILSVFYVLLVAVVLAACGSQREFTRLPASAIPHYQQLDEGNSSRIYRSDHLVEHYFLEGSILEMREKYKEAIREYQYALRFDSAPGAVYYAIAKCYRAIGRDDSALTYASQAVELDSENTGARTQYAELLLENGRLYASVMQYEKVIEQEPNNTEVRYTLARLWQRRDPDRSIQHYEYIRQRLDNSFDALLNLSELYLDRRQYNKAIDVMRDVLEFGITTPDIFRLLTDTYMRAGRYDEAIAMIDEATTRLVSDSLVEVYIIEQLDKVNSRLIESRTPPLGLRNLATALASRGGELLPSSSRVRLHSGLVLLRLKEEYRADTLIAHALLDTILTQTDWSTAAGIYIADKEYSRGLQVLIPSSMRFDDAEVSYRLGALYAGAGRIDSATRYLRRAITLDESNAGAWAELGAVYSSEGNVGAGLASYEKAIFYDPDNPDYRNACALLLAERNIHLDRALELARQALHVEPENENYLHTLGWIYYRLEDYDRALQYIQRSVAIGGAGPRVIEHLGDVQRARGDLASARDAYQQALKSDPGNHTLLEKLDAVK
jgi:tetratricopeptide (TPR) repeat protein